MSPYEVLEWHNRDLNCTSVSIASSYHILYTQAFISWRCLYVWDVLLHCITYIVIQYTAVLITYTTLFTSPCLEWDICDGLIAGEGLVVTLDVVWTVVVSHDSESVWLVDDLIIGVYCVAVIVEVMVVDDEEHSNPVNVTHSTT